MSGEAPVLAAVGRGFEQRFLFVAVAAQRVIQIRNGSRPRVDAGNRKPAVVAIAEVLAGYVPYISS
jgi:DNA-directed RNA polymerase subunit K/omega